MFHLNHIGPPATKAGVVNVMDFDKVTSLIGRNKGQVDFVLDSSNHVASQYISRLHARVVRQENNAYRLFDDSLNGIFINNTKLMGSVVLHEGDIVTFGHPYGARLKPGVWTRQPDSEYQFIFEKCTCEKATIGKQTVLEDRVNTHSSVFKKPQEISPKILPSQKDIKSKLSSTVCRDQTVMACPNPSLRDSVSASSNGFSNTYDKTCVKPSGSGTSESLSIKTDIESASCSDSKSNQENLYQGLSAFDLKETAALAEASSIINKCMTTIAGMTKALSSSSCVSHRKGDSSSEHSGSNTSTCHAKEMDQDKQAFDKSSSKLNEPSLSDTQVLDDSINKSLLASSGDDSDSVFFGKRQETEEQNKSPLKELVLLLPSSKLNESSLDETKVLDESTGNLLNPPCRENSHPERKKIPESESQVFITNSKAKEMEIVCPVTTSSTLSSSSSSGLFLTSASSLSSSTSSSSSSTVLCSVVTSYSNNLNVSLSSISSNSDVVTSALSTNSKRPTPPLSSSSCLKSPLIPLPPTNKDSAFTSQCSFTVSSAAMSETTDKHINASNPSQEAIVDVTDSTSVCSNQSASASLSSSENKGEGKVVSETDHHRVESVDDALVKTPQRVTFANENNEKQDKQPLPHSAGNTTLITRYQSSNDKPSTSHSHVEKDSDNNQDNKTSSSTKKSSMQSKSQTVTSTVSKSCSIHNVRSPSTSSTSYVGCVTRGRKRKQKQVCSCCTSDRLPKDKKSVTDLTPPQSSNSKSKNRQKGAENSKQNSKDESNVYSHDSDVVYLMSVNNGVIYISDDEEDVSIKKTMAVTDGSLGPVVSREEICITSDDGVESDNVLAVNSDVYMSPLTSLCDSDEVNEVSQSNHGITAASEIVRETELVVPVCVANEEPSEVASSYNIQDCTEETSMKKKMLSENTEESSEDEEMPEQKFLMPSSKMNVCDNLDGIAGGRKETEDGQIKCMLLEPAVVFEEPEVESGTNSTSMDVSVEIKPTLKEEYSETKDQTESSLLHDFKIESGADTSNQRQETVCERLPQHSGLDTSDNNHRVKCEKAYHERKVVSFEESNVCSLREDSNDLSSGGAIVSLGTSLHSASHERTSSCFSAAALKCEKVYEGERLMQNGDELKEVISYVKPEVDHNDDSARDADIFTTRGDDGDITCDTVTLSVVLQEDAALPNEDGNYTLNVEISAVGTQVKHESSVADAVPKTRNDGIIKEIINHGVTMQIHGDKFTPQIHRDDEVTPQIHHDDEVTPQIEDDDDVTPQIQDDDFTPQIHDDVTPQIQHDDVTPQVHDDDVIPQIHDDDDTPQIHDDEDHVTPQIHDDDVTPQIQDDDVTPQIHDDVTPQLHGDDVIPQIHDDDDVAPQIHNDDVIPQIHDDEDHVTPQIHDDDVIPRLHDDDDTPQIQDDVTPQIHDDVTPQLHDDDVIPQIHDDDDTPQIQDDVTPQIHNDDVTPQIHADHTPQLHDDDVIPQIHDDDDVAPQIHDDDVIPQIHDDEDHVTPQIHDDDVIPRIQDDVAPQTQDDDVIPQIYDDEDHVTPQIHDDDDTPQIQDDVTPQIHNDDVTPQIHADHTPQLHDDDVIPQIHDDDDVAPQIHDDDVIPQIHDDEDHVTPQIHDDDVIPRIQDDVAPQTQDDDVIRQIHDDDDVPPQIHDDDVTPQIHDDDVTPQIHDDVTPQLHDDDVIPQIHDDDDVIPQIHDDVTPQIHDDDVTPQIHDDVTPQLHDDDVMPQIHDDDDVIPQIHDDVTPQIHDDDDTPQIQDDVTPQIHDDDVTPQIHDDDVTPQIHDDDVTPQIHDDGTPQLHGDDVIPQIYDDDDDVAPQIHDDDVIPQIDDDVIPQIHDDEDHVTPQIHDDDVIRQIHDDDDVPPQIHDDDDTPQIQNDVTPQIHDDDVIPQIHDDEDHVTPQIHDDDVIRQIHDDDDVPPQIHDDDDTPQIQNDVTPQIHDDDVTPQLHDDDVMPQIHDDDDVIPQIHDDEDHVTPQIHDDDVIPQIHDDEDHVTPQIHDDDVIRQIHDDDDVPPQIHDDDDTPQIQNDVTPQIHDDDVTPQLHDDDVMPQIHDDDDVIPQIHDDEDHVTPQIHDDDVIPQIHDDEDHVTPQIHDDDVIPRIQDDDVAPQIQDDVTPQIHDDDVIRQIHDDDVAPQIQDEVTPQIHDDDVIRQIHDDDVAPQIHDDDTPQIHDDDVTPQIHDDDVIPRIQDHDVTPQIHDGDDVTPQIHDDDVMPQVHDDDVTPQIHDDDVTPPIHNDDVTPQIHDDDVTPQIHDDDVAPQIHDDVTPQMQEGYQVTPQIYVKNILPRIQDYDVTDKTQVNGVTLQIEDDCLLQTNDRDVIPQSHDDVSTNCSQDDLGSKTDHSDYVRARSGYNVELGIENTNVTPDTTIFIQHVLDDSSSHLKEGELQHIQDENCDDSAPLFSSVGIDTQGNVDSETNFAEATFITSTPAEVVTSKECVVSNKHISPVLKLDMAVTQGCAVANEQSVDSLSMDMPVSEGRNSTMVFESVSCTSQEQLMGDQSFEKCKPTEEIKITEEHSSTVLKEESTKNRGIVPLLHSDEFKRKEEIQQAAILTSGVMEIDNTKEMVLQSQAKMPALSNNESFEIQGNEQRLLESTDDVDTDKSGAEYSRVYVLQSAAKAPALSNNESLDYQQDERGLSISEEDLDSESERESVDSNDQTATERRRYDLEMLKSELDHLDDDGSADDEDVDSNDETESDKRESYRKMLMDEYECLKQEDKDELERKKKRRTRLLFSESPEFGVLLDTNQIDEQNATEPSHDSESEAVDAEASLVETNTELSSSRNKEDDTIGSESPESEDCCESKNECAGSSPSTSENGELEQDMNGLVYSESQEFDLETETSGMKAMQNEESETEAGTDDDELERCDGVATGTCSEVYEVTIDDGALDDSRLLQKRKACTDDGEEKSKETGWCGEEKESEEVDLCCKTTDIEVKENELSISEMQQETEINRQISDSLGLQAAACSKDEKVAGKEENGSEQVVLLQCDHEGEEATGLSQSIESRNLPCKKVQNCLKTYLLQSSSERSLTESSSSIELARIEVDIHHETSVSDIYETNCMKINDSSGVTIREIVPIPKANTELTENVQLADERMSSPPQDGYNPDVSDSVYGLVSEETTFASNSSPEKLQTSDCVFKLPVSVSPISSADHQHQGPKDSQTSMAQCSVDSEESESWCSSSCSSDIDNQPKSQVSDFKEEDDFHLRWSQTTDTGSSNQTQTSLEWSEEDIVNASILGNLSTSAQSDANEKDHLNHNPDSSVQTCSKDNNIQREECKSDKSDNEQEEHGLCDTTTTDIENTAEESSCLDERDATGQQNSEKLDNQITMDQNVHSNEGLLKDLKNTALKEEADELIGTFEGESVDLSEEDDLEVRSGRIHEDQYEKCVLKRDEEEGSVRDSNSQCLVEGRTIDSDEHSPNEGTTEKKDADDSSTSCDKDYYSNNVDTPGFEEDVMKDEGGIHSDYEVVKVKEVPLNNNEDTETETVSRISTSVEPEILCDWSTHGHDDEKNFDFESGMKLNDTEAVHGEREIEENSSAEVDSKSTSCVNYTSEGSPVVEETRQKCDRALGTIKNEAENVTLKIQDGASNIRALHDSHGVASQEITDIVDTSGFEEDAMKDDGGIRSDHEVVKVTEVPFNSDENTGAETVVTHQEITDNVNGTDRKASSNLKRSHDGCDNAESDFMLVKKIKFDDQPEFVADSPILPIVSSIRNQQEEDSDFEIELFPASNSNQSLSLSRKRKLVSVSDDQIVASVELSDEAKKCKLLCVDNVSTPTPDLTSTNISWTPIQTQTGLAHISCSSSSSLQEEASTHQHETTVLNDNIELVDDGKGLQSATADQNHSEDNPDGSMLSSVAEEIKHSEKVSDSNEESESEENFTTSNSNVNWHSDNNHTTNDTYPNVKANVQHSGHGHNSFPHLTVDETVSPVIENQDTSGIVCSSSSPEVEIDSKNTVTAIHSLGGNDCEKVRKGATQSPSLPILSLETVCESESKNGGSGTESANGVEMLSTKSSHVLSSPSMPSSTSIPKSQEEDEVEEEEDDSFAASTPPEQRRAKRESLYTAIIQELQRMNKDIRMFLSKDKPNVEQAIEVLEDLQDTPINSTALTKFPPILETLNKSRRYKQSEEVRQLSQRLYDRFKALLI